MDDAHSTTPEGDEPNDAEASSPDSLQHQMTMHPIAYPGMPMHMYPYPPGMIPAQPLRSKRRQVKNACTNCQKACKKCDDARPCLRCVKYGIGEECVDSQRKERKKGIKRGPYKKRDGKDRAGNDVEQPDIPAQQVVSGVPNGAPAAPPPGMPPAMPYPPVGYPGFYGQFPPGPHAKPGEAPAYYPQFYITAMPPPPQHVPGQEGEAQAFPHPAYYPTFITPYGQPYAPYMLPHMGPDQMRAAYPFMRPPSVTGASSEASVSAVNGKKDGSGEGAKSGDATLRMNGDGK